MYYICYLKFKETIITYLSEYNVKHSISEINEKKNLQKKAKFRITAKMGVKINGCL